MADTVTEHSFTGGERLPSLHLHRLGRSNVALNRLSGLSLQDTLVIAVFLSDRYPRLMRRRLRRSMFNKYCLSHGYRSTILKHTLGARYLAQLDHLCCLGLFVLTVFLSQLSKYRQLHNGVSSVAVFQLQYIPCNRPTLAGSWVKRMDTQGNHGGHLRASCRTIFQ